MLLKAGFLICKSKQHLLRQQAKTAEVTELEKVNFDITSGNLKALSEAQKEQLRYAAKIIDSKKKSYG